MPSNTEDPKREWPRGSSGDIAHHIGYTRTSGTVTRALYGLRAGSGGKAHPGLISLGLIKEVPIDTCGLIETYYRITPAGIRAYRVYLDANDGVLPPVKGAAKSTNRRYRR
jgi:hypothetical protein